MSSSPFLTSLRISDSVFDLSSDLTPISIRDQIVRASVFVDHLAAHVTSSKTGQPLRVVVAGGGVAGAVCVMRALARRFEVTWIEKKGSPFTLQLDSDRWIAPFFYEWPWGPWWADRFPAIDREAMLSFSAGISGEIAREWQSRFAAIATLPVSQLTYRPNTSLDSHGRKISSDGSVTVIVSYTTTDEHRLPVHGKVECDVLILATGAGVERSLGSYRGHSFWAIDPFRRFASRLAERPRILVSGSGDGALQDFIRICTGIDDAAMIYQRLYDANPSLNDDVKRELHATELQSRFSPHLRLEPGCSELTRIENAYSEQIKRLADDSAICRTVRDLCADRRGWSVHFLHPCVHSSPLYGINRLMVGLFARIRDDVRVFSTYKLVRVESIDRHTCGDPDRCFGKEHAVYAERKRCGQPPAAAGALGVYLGNYEVVVLRHGLDALRRRSLPVQQFLPPHPLAAD